MKKEDCDYSYLAVQELRERKIKFLNQGHT